MTQDRYLSAKEAAAELDVTVATIYAYVSRGLIRSEATSDSKRTRRYLREDIDKLKAQKEARRDPTVVAETALHWGTPVLESAITMIADGRFYYRGHDALELAATQRVEQVAALIWLGEEADAGLFDVAGEIIAPRVAAIRPQLEDLTPVETFQAALPLAAASDIASYDRRPAAVARTGARMLHLLTALAAGVDDVAGSIAATLQRGWLPDDPQAAELLNAALILCADHELNVSSFTARCVASAGATPYGVVSAGLAALQGAKHGGHTERVEGLFREAGTPEGVHAAMVSRLKRGESVPGFGHPLYPQGDPRFGALLTRVQAAYPTSAAMTEAAVTAAAELLGELATLDVGLVTVAHALKLPPGGALAIFALGRTIGWLGHAIEQYRTDRMIRPRARYVGVLP